MTKRPVTGGRPLQLPRHPPPLASGSSSNSDSNEQALVDLHNPSKAALSIKHLRRLCTLLEQEVALLEKIRYKQKNQHKAATWWRHVTGSQRVAKRFGVAFSTELGSILPLVDTTAASEARPALSGQAIIRSVEGCLRLLHLAEHSLPIHAKAMAALEQLLRAALFMPLAMALKGLIARLDALSRLFDAELRHFLLILDATTRRQPGLAKSLKQRIRGFPKALQGYLRPLSDMSATSTRLSALRSLPGSTAASASPASSALPSAAPSRLASPSTSEMPPPGPEDIGVAVSKPEGAIARGKKRADTPDPVPTTLEQKRRRMEQMTGHPGPNMDDTSGPPQQDLTPAPPPLAIRVKKRKKPAAPRDDIDDIFGGL